MKKKSEFVIYPLQNITLHNFFCKKHDGQFLNVPVQLFLDYKILFHYQIPEKLQTPIWRVDYFFVTKTVISRQVSGLILLIFQEI